MGSPMKREDVVHLLRNVDWPKIRSLMKTTSDDVPESFLQLIDSQTDAQAKEAYWRLDNRVMVQGQLFQAAEKLVPAILAALQLDLSPSARHRLVELLTEIALGVPDKSEVIIGNS